MDAGLMGYALIGIVMILAYLVGQSAQAGHAITIALKAFELATESHIAVKALEKSSHTLIPVHSGPNGLDGGDMEAKLRKLAGLASEDFSSDLARAGLDVETPEDLV